MFQHALMLPKPISSGVQADGDGEQEVVSTGKYIKIKVKDA